MSASTPAIEAWIERYRANPSNMRRPVTPKSKPLTERISEAKRRGFKSVMVDLETIERLMK